MDRKDTLIDSIAATLKLRYLSDMRQKEFYLPIYNIIKECNEDEFSKRDWVELYCYLSGKKINDNELKDVYMQLLNYLDYNK